MYLLTGLLFFFLCACAGVKLIIVHNYKDLNVLDLVFVFVTLPFSLYFSPQATSIVVVTSAAHAWELYTFVSANYVGSSVLAFINVIFAQFTDPYIILAHSVVMYILFCLMLLDPLNWISQYKVFPVLSKCTIKFLFFSFGVS